MARERDDPVKYIHSFFWRFRCMDATSTEFQKLFEEVMTRARRNFVRVRP